MLLCHLCGNSITSIHTRTLVSTDITHKDTQKKDTIPGKKYYILINVAILLHLSQYQIIEMLLSIINLKKLLPLCNLFNSLNPTRMRETSLCPLLYKKTRLFL